MRALLAGADTEQGGIGPQRGNSGVRGAVAASILMMAESRMARLGLAPLEGVEVPVPLNIVFVGFDHDGHHRGGERREGPTDSGLTGLNIAPEDLAGWFDRFGRKLPATRVHLDHATITPEDQAFAPNLTDVTYSYETRIVELTPDVTTAIEMVLWDAMRPEHPWNSNPCGGKLVRTGGDGG